ncbi:MAG: hypothetical protein PHV14_07820 [Bacteroidales bacterium]|nr:hypothetical protein [Clostridia bacterium]MDD3812173.1 hypothetical protein [Bacteroidales bacterium]MDD3972917.1 hypothetical protein [Clostridia bacterium]MDD4812658.1 hypothetical protein [Bacteroidales bacterium]
MKKRALRILLSLFVVASLSLSDFIKADVPGECNLPAPWICGQKRGPIYRHLGWYVELIYCCKRSINSNACDPTSQDISELCREVTPVPNT